MSDLPARYRSLLELAPDVPLERNVPLARIGRWQIGGTADVVATPTSVEEVSRLFEQLHRLELPRQIIGDGSNILFDDDGYRGVIVRLTGALSRLEFLPDNEVVAGGGLWVPDFVRRVSARGLAGCVHAVGIPGRLGGLVCMNGGSQRKGIGDQLVSVTIVNEDGVIEVLDREACGFAYRTSSLQGRKAAVLEARFRYEPADPALLRREMLSILRERRTKFPRKQPNCGSVFLSDPAMYSIVGPPGKAIEQVGLKGTRLGAAQISPLHANFIVNLGGARSTDVLGLIHRARETVHERTGFWMDCEVRHLAPDGRFRMAHVSALEQAERVLDRTRAYSAGE